MTTTNRNLVDSTTDSAVLHGLITDLDPTVRASIARNRYTISEDLETLANASDPMLRCVLLSNPKFPLSAIHTMLEHETDPGVRAKIETVLSSSQRIRETMDLDVANHFLRLSEKWRSNK